MVPADQSLDAENRSVGEPHDRLVVQLELIHGQCVLQVGPQLEPLDDALVHRRLEDAVAALAVTFRHVHRHVGVAQELRCLWCLDFLTDKADPDARPREHVLSFDLDRKVERAKDSRRCVGSVRRAGHAVEEDGELVASEARDGVARPDGDLETTADLLQDLVPGCMTETVVDRLEVVQVDEHDCDLVDAALRAHQRVLDAVGEERAVGELRHRVVERLMRELLLEGLTFTDVAAVEHDATDMLVMQKVGVLDLEPQSRTVPVTDGTLDRVSLGVARAVNRDQLRKQRPVGLTEQPVEPRSFDLVDPVSEQALDRRALVGDEAVGVQHGDEVAGVRNERAEPRLTLASMEILGERRPFHRE